MKFIYCFVLLCCNCSFAQSDTSYVYLLKGGGETSKDSAYTVVKFYKLNNAWHGKETYVKNGVVRSDGEYAENNLKAPLGTFNNYTEAGKLDYTASYNNGKPLEVTYFYKNGNKKSWMNFDEKGVKDQKGWDETGKEIKNFIVRRPAAFKGGEEGWIKYLKKNLNGNIATDAGAPVGQYHVDLLFKIDPQGNTSNIKVLSAPAKCRPCAGEAVRVIQESREWQPAIFQNEQVDFYLRQRITFVVEEEKKKKG
ncbi:MAG: hypothetical protein QM726_15165 [Chitinophagaceae bacterium]